MSPHPAAGNRFSRPLTPWTAITYKFFPPVLSAQLMTAPTGRPNEIRNLAPAVPPLPEMGKYVLIDSFYGQHNYQSPTSLGHGEVT